LHTLLEVAFKHNRCDSSGCVSRDFKAKLRAFAATLLNGPHKSEQSETLITESNQMMHLRSTSYKSTKLLTIEFSLLL